MRTLPLIFLSFVSLSRLTGFARVMITLALFFFISGAFLRTVLDKGNQLAWAGSALMAIICYGICFWREAQITKRSLVKTTPIVLLLSLSSFWAFPAYDVMKPAMWSLTATATFMSVGAALHRSTAHWVYLGGLSLFSSLAFFALQNRESLGGLALYIVFFTYFFSHIAIVLGLIQFQTAREKQYNDIHQL